MQHTPGCCTAVHCNDLGRLVCLQALLVTGRLAGTWTSVRPAALAAIAGTAPTSREAGSAAAPLASSWCALPAALPCLQAQAVRSAVEGFARLHTETYGKCTHREHGCS